MIKQMIASIFVTKPIVVVSQNVETVDEEIKRYSDSLEVKRKAAIERLGEKWLLHPKNQIKNMNVGKNILGFKTA
jgi:hypothetical protein